MKMDIKNMVRDFNLTGRGTKKRSSVYVKAVACCVRPSSPGAVLHEHDRPGWRTGSLSWIPAESSCSEVHGNGQVIRDPVEGPLQRGGLLSNSFDRMSISGSRAQAVFLVEKSELNAIWNKYLNDRAYADAADRVSSTSACLRSCTGSGYVMTVYNVLFTSILSIHDAGGVKRIRIYSRGDAMRTTRPIRRMWQASSSGTIHRNTSCWIPRMETKKLNKTEEHEEDSSNHCQRVRVYLSFLSSGQSPDERKGRESEHRPS